MRARVSLTVAALALAVGIGFAGGFGESAAAQALPVEIGLGEYVFIPAEVTVPAGLTTFNLTNTDSRRHNMVIGYNGLEMESETVDAGAAGVWEVTLDQPGTYEFWCNVGNHRERGMVGMLTVQ
jgi:plastocyanin